MILQTSLPRLVWRPFRSCPLPEVTTVISHPEPERGKLFFPFPNQFFILARQGGDALVHNSGQL